MQCFLFPQSTAAGGTACEYRHMWGTVDMGALRSTEEWRNVKDLEAIARGLNDILERGHLSGGTDENHGKRQSRGPSAYRTAGPDIQRYLHCFGLTYPCRYWKGNKKCHHYELSENAKTIYSTRFIGVRDSSKGTDRQKMSVSNMVSREPQ
jgi:hypothetical protein